MKKLFFFTLVIPSALCAYVIQNNSGFHVWAELIYMSSESPEPLSYGRTIKDGESFGETEVFHFFTQPGEEPKRIDRARVEKRGDHLRNDINLSMYSDEQITRTENPVVFTIYPDFTITASEEGNRFYIPPAPPAPFPPVEAAASAEHKRSNAAAKNGNGSPKRSPKKVAGCE